jgi:hypothetical protein
MNFLACFFIVHLLSIRKSEQRHGTFKIFNLIIHFEFVISFITSPFARHHHIVRGVALSKAGGTRLRVVK